MLFSPMIVDDFVFGPKWRGARLDAKSMPRAEALFLGLCGDDFSSFALFLRRN